MKNGYRITDAHAHVFPDKIAEKATEGISHFYDLPMQYHGRVAEMLENGTAAGIDHFLVCSPATTVTQVHSINSFLASCAAAYPMCTAFGTLHPYAENSSCDPYSFAVSSCIRISRIFPLMIRGHIPCTR